MGYIKCPSKNKNITGVFLEKLLGSTGGDFNIPDFYDIEIKALRKYFKAEFELFNSAPDGKYPAATKWISENYGYPDKDFKNIKVIKGNVYSNKIVSIGIKFKFKLEIKKEEQKIYLNIYDNKNNMINNDIYWDFSSLKEKLERKISKLAIFGFDKKIIDNDLYILYNKINLYKLKNFNSFLKCIEKGKIFLTLNTGINKSGKYIGKYTDHGSSFRICKKDLSYLFDEYSIVWGQKKEPKRF